MEQSYAHLDLEDRCAIARLHQQGCSIRQIAAAPDRSPSSISRELKRNSGTQLGYKPAYADQKAKARRWTGSKLERDHELREIVLQGLARRWSPEQVAGWLRRSKPPRRISYETIYRFIYAQIRRTNDGAWRLYLPRQKYKRGRRPRPGGSPAKLIKDRVPISLRPKAADARRQTGHWEADLMLFRKYGQAILAAHERKSRILLLAKQPSKRAKPTIRRLLAWLKPFDNRLVRTLTFDNGTEFAEHHTLTQQSIIMTTDKRYSRGADSIFDVSCVVLIADYGVRPRTSTGFLPAFAGMTNMMITAPFAGLTGREERQRGEPPNCWSRASSSASILRSTCHRASSWGSSSMRV